MSYPWAYFRRTSREFMWDAIPGAVSNNYFRKLRASHWQVANDLMSSTGTDVTTSVITPCNTAAIIIAAMASAGSRPF